MSLRIVTPGSSDGFLTLDEAKAQLGLEQADDDWDELIQGWIRAALNYIESQTQRRYLSQTIEWVRRDLCDVMTLPIAAASKPDEIAVGFVKYMDLQGTQQTLDPALYWVRPAGATMSIVRRRFVTWPWLGDGAELAVIQFTLTIDKADIPDNVLTAAKLLVSHWFRNRDAVVGVENRDSSAPLPLGVEDLIASERWS